ncbi:PEP-CTERM sorting domain-containing protein [Sabulicella glaciei]|uniref:PEP-CTERM sorting domain-containing protein n=1 Tax=Sabulicella glaciei TaxID=2984948 RepID=A0ABT3NZA5_9PROT|nr:PEP-CTERM sorting domain-containing protein [Roseococcus sp. MDT2-1-1]MCW8087491.1 PEP-CTERM sorting domain-containing protein [Roseococcus sp. MDT2-1-1]
MRKLLLATVALVGVALAAPGAQAALIATIEGNACAGEFGTPPNCVTSGTYNGVTLNQTPLIAKFDFNENGIVTAFTPGIFPTIDGWEFSFAFGPGGTGDATYTYTPGAGDPLLQYVAVKGGPNFNLFTTPGSGSDTVFTPTNPGGNLRGLSNISFYDTLVPVPAPAGLMLLGAGLLGLGLMRRKAA